MKYYFFFFFLVFSTAASSQILGDGEVYLQGDLINPKFKGGGIENFYDYVNQHYDFGKVKKQGKMLVSFVINQNGEVTDIRIIQLIDVESATEMIRVLKNSPKWEPATKNGNPTSITIKFPFEFKLKD